LWPTLAIVVVTAVLGATMVRSQGAGALAGLRQSLNDLEDPTEHLAHGAMILFSGALLLTPGFFTDTIGFALLIPGIRRAVYRYLRQRIRIARFRVGPQNGPPPPGDRVVDAEYRDVSDSRKRPTHEPSGWTKH